MAHQNKVCYRNVVGIWRWSIAQVWLQLEYLIVIIRRHWQQKLPHHSMIKGICNDLLDCQRTTNNGLFFLLNWDKSCGEKWSLTACMSEEWNEFFLFFLVEIVQGSPFSLKSGKRVEYPHHPAIINFPHKR
jgi:hypothetical protein